MDTIYFGVMVAMYFIPTIIASGRGKRNTLAIGMLNLFLGWTFIGWVVALIWACTAEDVRDKEKPAPSLSAGVDNGKKVLFVIVVGICAVTAFGLYGSGHEDENEPETVTHSPQ